MSKKVQEIVTSKIIEALETGVAPWRKTWKTARSKNLISGRPYSGANALLTHPMVTGFKEPSFVTKNQIKQMGMKVKEGERYIPIIFYGTGKNKETEKSFRFQRFYPVYNVEQIEGFEISEQKEDREECINKNAEEIIAEWSGKLPIRYGNHNPCYSPMVDTIFMPEIKSFESDAEYYSTIFHELSHATGHGSRLNRESVASLKRDSHKYSEEELVAELGSAFLCHHTGVEGVFDNQASYCQNWLYALKNDRSIILRAARQADKSFKLIIGES